MRPFPFEPLPSSLAVASELVRARFDEARQSVLRREEEDRAQNEDEPGKIWREKWRKAAKKTVVKFRVRICAVTGLLCENSKDG